jgi:hypothetical protein
MEASVIDRAMIEDLFARTRQLARDGCAGWDIDDVCRWSYFFVDPDPDRLLAAGEALEADGYELVGLLDDEEEEPESFLLRVDRVEQHTVESLVARNAELYAFAERHGLEGYDGMDVGAVEGP